MIKNICLKYPLGFMILLGVLVRLPFIFLSAVHGDEGMYMYDAKLILEGSVPFADFHTRAPVFIYSLALFMGIFGESVYTARFFSLLIYVVTTVVIYRIGKIIHSRNAGLISSAVFSLSPFAITWSVVVETEVYLIFFVSLAALFLLKGLELEDGVDQSKSGSYVRFRSFLILFLSGLILGVSVFTRRTGFVVLPAFLLYTYFRSVRFDFTSGDHGKGKGPNEGLSGKWFTLCCTIACGFFLSFLFFMTMIIVLRDVDYFMETFVSSVGLGSTSANRLNILRGLVHHAWYLIFPIIIFCHIRIRRIVTRYLRNVMDIGTFLIFALIVSVYTFISYILLIPILGYFLFIMIDDGAEKQVGDRSTTPFEYKRIGSGFHFLRFIIAFLILGIVVIAPISEAVFFHYFVIIFFLLGVLLLHLILRVYSRKDRNTESWFLGLIALVGISLLTISDVIILENVFTILILMSTVVMISIIRNLEKLDCLGSREKTEGTGSLEPGSRKAMGLIGHTGKRGSGRYFPILWFGAVGGFYLTYNMLGEIYLYELLPPASLMVGLFLESLYTGHPELMRSIRALDIKELQKNAVVSFTILIIILSATISGFLYIDDEILYDDPGRIGGFDHIPGPKTINDVGDYLRSNTTSGSEILTANMAIAVAADRPIVMDLSHPSVYSTLYKRGFASLETIKYPSLSELMDHMNRTITKYVVYDLFLNQYYLKFNPVFKDYIFSHYQIEKRIDNVDIYVRSNYDEINRLSINADPSGHAKIAHSLYVPDISAVVWEQVDGDYGAICYAWISGTGQEYQGRILSPKGSSNSFSPDGTLDSNGRLHAVWEQDYDNYSLLSYAVVDKNGSREIMLLTTREDRGVYMRDPVIRVDQFDNVHIVWVENRFGSFALYYTILDEAGNYILESEEIMKGPGDILDPAMDINGNGDRHIVFEDGSSGKFQINYISLKGSLSNASEFNISEPIELSYGEKGLDPAISVDLRGGVHVTWKAYTSQNHEYIRYHFQNSMSEPDTAVVRVNITDPDNNRLEKDEDDAYEVVDSPALAVTGDEIHITFSMKIKDENQKVYHISIPFNSEHRPDLSTLLEDEMASDEDLDFDVHSTCCTLDEYVSMDPDIAVIENGQGGENMVIIVHTGVVRKNSDIYLKTVS